MHRDHRHEQRAWYGDCMEILTQYLITFGWALTGAVSMAVALGIAVKIFNLLSPINEWEQLEKGNVSVAIVMAAVIIGVSLVVGLIVQL
jgi:uncharacterized membrane protein YjfL (UPF0719 family)